MGAELLGGAAMLGGGASTAPQSTGFAQVLGIFTAIGLVGLGMIPGRALPAGPAAATWADGAPAGPATSPWGDIALTVLAGNATTSTWVKGMMTELAPCAVSNLGILTATRQRP